MDFDSVLIYLIVFIISLVATYIAEKLFADKRRSEVSYLIGILFSVFAILLPCFLAQMRDVSVGTDIKGYVLPNYNIARNCKSFTLFYSVEYSKVELLFSVLIYIGAKIGNIGVTFFLIEFLTIFPIYYVLYKRREKASMTMGMLLFYFLFYNFSFSGMRQSIAMSFMLLAFYMITNDRKLKSLIYAIIAALFHSSAILIIPIYILISYIYKSPEKKRKKFYVIIIIVLYILFFNYERIAWLLQRIVGFISGRYAFYIANYLNVYSGIVWGNIHATDLLCKLIIILFAMLVFKISNKNDAEAYYMIFMLLIGRYFVIFNAVFYESLRFAYYFDYFLIIFIPCIFKCVKKNYLNKIIVMVGIMIPSLLYWFYYIMFIGGYGTNQYIMRK